MVIYVYLKKQLVKCAHVHTHTHTFNRASHTTHAHTHTVLTHTRTPHFYVLTTAARGQRSSPVTLGALSTGHRGLLDRSLRLGKHLTVNLAVMLNV